MGVISKKTAAEIFNCHNEIDKANQLIKDMAESYKSNGDVKLQDAFGERNGMQLGVPSGRGSHTLFNVDIDLSFKIIEKHIEQKTKRLDELMAIANIELKA